MSTGLECAFFERNPGEWWYALEDWNSPKGAWNWRDYASAYGPFPSYETAREHLHRHHANPGGHWILRHSEAKDWSTYDRLIAEAKERDARIKERESEWRWPL